MTEKNVQYSTVATYSTLGVNGPKTSVVWMVFHGLGYLSKYFLRYFEGLDLTANYVIAPQAPSKYYLDERYKNVGACWLTRINTEQEIDNVLNYVDAVWKAEKSERNDQKLVVLGYSQGVSIATRWLARRKIGCDRLILHSGGIPRELGPGDFEHLPIHCRVTYLYGDQDEYIDQARNTEESLRASRLFADRLETRIFQGKHEVNRKFLEETAVSLHP